MSKQNLEQTSHSQTPPQQRAMHEQMEHWSASWHRLHPVTLLYQAVIALPGLLIPFLLSQSSTESTFFFLGMMVISLLIVVPLVIAQYLYFSYCITPNEVIVRQGVFRRETRSIPLERIQNVEIRQNIFHRLLRIAHVLIDTAGAQGTEASLQYVSLRHAEQIRTTIASHQRSSRDALHEHSKDSATDTSAESIHAVEGKSFSHHAFQNEHPHASQQEQEQELLYSLGWKEAIVAGALRFRWRYMFLLVYPFQYFEFLSAEAKEELFQTLRKARTYAEFDIWSSVAVFILTLTLASWVVGMLIDVNRYYGYRLTITGRKLLRRQGLLTHSQGTTLLQRIQMMAIIAHNPLWRIFRYRSFSIYTASIAAGASKVNDVEVPIGHEAAFVQLAQRLRSVSMPERLQSVSPKTIQRAFVRYVLLLCIGGAAWLGMMHWMGNSISGSMVLWQAVLGFVVLPLLYYGAVLRFQHRGYALTKHTKDITQQASVTVFIRQGFWRERLLIVPLEKIQSIEVRASPFQRLLRLATVELDIASTTWRNDPRIVDVDADDAEAILRELSTHLALVLHRPTVS